MELVALLWQSIIKVKTSFDGQRLKIKLTVLMSCKTDYQDLLIT
jgi:hypothetical protein